MLFYCYVVKVIVVVPHDESYDDAVVASSSSSNGGSNREDGTILPVVVFVWYSCFCHRHRIVPDVIIKRSTILVVNNCTTSIGESGTHRFGLIKIRVLLVSVGPFRNHASAIATATATVSCCNNTSTTSIGPSRFAACLPLANLQFNGTIMV